MLAAVGADQHPHYLGVALGKLGKRFCLQFQPLAPMQTAHEQQEAALPQSREGAAEGARLGGSSKAKVNAVRNHKSSQRTRQQSA